MEKRKALIAILLIFILIVLGLVLFFGYLKFFSGVDRNSEFSFNDCLKTMGEDDCYIKQARIENSADLCDLRVSEERKQDCYDVVIPEDYYEGGGFGSDEIHNLAGEVEGNEGSESLITGQIISESLITGEVVLNVAKNDKFPEFEVPIVAFADKREDFVVNSQITNLGPNARVSLMYKNSPYFGSEGWVEREMTNLGNGNFQGVIPLPEIDVAQNIPNMLSNGYFEEWESDYYGRWKGDKPFSWLMGQSTLASTTRQTEEGNDYLDLEFGRKWFVGNGGGDCNEGNSLALDGVIRSDNFVIDGDYINFFATTDDFIENYTNQFYGKFEDGEDKLLTPWGFTTNNYILNYNFYEKGFKPVISLVDESTGEVLKESIILPNVISSGLLEYEWDVSAFVGREVSIFIEDNSFMHNGVTLGNILQFSIVDEMLIEKEFKTVQGRVLKNINFEKGDLSDWNTNKPEIWSLVYGDKENFNGPESKELYRSVDPKIINNDVAWDLDYAGKFVRGGGNLFVKPKPAVLYDEKSIYTLVRPLVEDRDGDGNYFECASMRARYSGCYADKGTNAGYIAEVYVNEYNENALGNYVLTSGFSPYVHRQDMGKILDYTGKLCKSVDCYDGGCDCGIFGCEVSIHNNWSGNVIAQQPYEVSYKLKADKGFVSSQVILWCDYEGDAIGHTGSRDGVDYKSHLESRGKYFAGASCVAGDEWKECSGTIIAPPDVTKCSVFRLDLGAQMGARHAYLDDYEIRPLRTGVRYYVKVENDYGVFASVLPDYEKDFKIVNNELDLKSIKKPITLLSDVSGDESWKDYEFRLEIRDEEQLSFIPGDAYGEIIFAATDDLNYYSVGYGLNHGFVVLMKTENGVKTHLSLSASTKNLFNKKFREDRWDKLTLFWIPKYDDDLGYETTSSNKWYKTAIIIEGRNIKIYLEGGNGYYNLIIDETLQEDLIGKIGFRSYASLFKYKDLEFKDSGNVIGGILDENNFKIHGNLFKRALAVSVGIPKPWENVLDVRDFTTPATNGGLRTHNWSFTPTTARYVALTIKDTSTYCTRSFKSDEAPCNGRWEGGVCYAYRGRDYPGHFISYISNLDLIDVNGENVLLNKPVIETNARWVSNVKLINDEDKMYGASIDPRAVEMLRYEPIARVVFDLGEDKEIEKLVLYSIGKTPAPTWVCDMSGSMDIRDFIIEVLADGAY